LPASSNPWSIPSAKWVLSTRSGPCSRSIKRTTEHVFGLCHLLGFRFAPRLRDLSERRLYVVDRRANDGVLDCLIGGAINLRRIGENWDETLRMTASIRAGTVAPSVLMRRLAAIPGRMPWPGRCVRLAVSNGPSSSSTGSQILRSDAVPTSGSTRAKPGTRSPAPCFSIATARSGTAPSKTSSLSPLDSEWAYHFLQAIEGSTCRRIRYRMFSQPGGLWACYVTRLWAG
jgi:hypothetical protein